MYWLAWIQANWNALYAGARLSAPQWLGPPLSSGFRRLEIAAPAGQTADWALSYNDGSRIHIHEYADGHFDVHRDRYDPDDSFGNLVAHIVQENFWFVVLGAIVLAVASGAKG